MKKIKRIISMTLVTVGLFMAFGANIPELAAADTLYVAATLVKYTLSIDDKSVSLWAYEIDGGVYFKLRDLAMALNGTKKQFKISWDGTKNAVLLTTGTAYTPVGGELTEPSKLTEPSNDKGTVAYSPTTTFYIDNRQIPIRTYTVNGTHYVMLSDLAANLMFSFTCDDQKHAADINTQIYASENMNRNNIENSDEPLWAQPIEEHGKLFTGLNLDGIGDHDDEAYVSLYDWDHNGFGRYDASELVVRIRFGTGDTTAHIVHAVGSYQFYTAKLFSEKKDAIVLEVSIQYANSGLVSVFVLDVYGPGEVDPFPSVVERLNTTGEAPILSTDGEKLYTGGLIQGTTIKDIENKPLQGIALHSSGEGYSGPIGDRVTQAIYWNGDGWIVLERSETKQN